MTVNFTRISDISDEAFVAAVIQAAAIRGHKHATRWDVAQVLGGTPENINEPRLAVLDVPGVPEKLVLAKASKMIRRGRLDGCACGCRGDFAPVN